MNTFETNFSGQDSANDCFATGVTDAGMEARARRAARAAGYRAEKSRWRLGSCDNFGGFRIVDPSLNIAVAGFTFDMTAEDVLHWCAD